MLGSRDRSPGRGTRAFALGTLAVAAVSAWTGAALAGAEEAAKTFSYVGTMKCKLCHMKPEDGAQFKIWSESAHAKAFATLATPEALAVGKKLGLAKPPQESAECLVCHTTGFKAPAEARVKVKPEDGVSCEACHGPGSDYNPKTVMTDVFAGKVTPASVGLLLPGEKTCTECHNEKSPSFKGFDFKTYSAKIAHPYPKEKAATRGRK